MTQPVPAPPGPIAPLDPAAQPVAAQLLQDLQGRWIGEGINTLWVPQLKGGPAPTPVPGYTTLVLDTNILLTSLPAITNIIARHLFTIIVPLPVIMELERQENILIIGHQAIVRCL